MSSISEEIKNNSTKGIYDPKKAQAKFVNRRKNSKYQSMKIIEDSSLRKEVEEMLIDDISPSNISGRIQKKSKGKKKISKESVYRFLNSIYGTNIKDLREKNKRRVRRRKRNSKLSERRNISKRPKIADNRRRLGDVEADFILSGKSSKSILFVLVDRKTRKSFLRKIEEVTIANVHKIFLEIQNVFPQIKTITLDNDILFKKHKELERLLKVKIYFCNPYHSWEKGSVENTNKYIRKTITKGSDISKYSFKFIQELENKLNRRPMEVLKFNTPDEEYLKHVFRKKR